MSHDETRLIRNQVSKAIPESKTFLVLPKELKGSVSIDDVLDLGRGGGKFKVLGQLIVSLNSDESDIHELPADEEESPDFLPIEGLNPHSLFAMIGNLLSPGLRFSKSVTFMAAILSLPNKFLGEMASN